MTKYKHITIEVINGGVFSTSTIRRRQVLVILRYKFGEFICIEYKQDARLNHKKLLIPAKNSISITID